MPRTPYWEVKQRKKALTESEKTEKALREAEEKARADRLLLLKAHKLSPSKLLEMHLSGERLPTLVKNKDAWEMVKSFDRRKNKELLDFLKIIFEKSDTFINDVNNIKSLSHILYYYKKGEAKNKIEDWNPRRRHATNQLKDLIDFLFLKYKAPAFLYDLFIVDEAAELFFHITNGRPFKKFPFVPALEMNNKVYHHLFSTPVGYNYFQAFRRAQILSIGGDERLATAFLSSRLGTPSTITVNGVNQDKFWVTVINGFVNTNMFNVDKIPEIIDYIFDQKYQQSMILGEMRIPMPNFSMKGRTPQTLLEKSETWHKNVARAARLAHRAVADGRYARWKPTPPPDYKWLPKPIKNYSATHTKKLDGRKVSVIYTITQLTSTKQLVDEASVMRNCVYSYASNCNEGKTAIFSMTEMGDKEMTIEVKNFEIVQAKIKGNLRPKKDSMAMEVLKDWAYKEKLTISKFAL